MSRETNGRWEKGASGNPKGRPSKTREARFLEITLQTVTFEDWTQVVSKAKEQAKRGDSVARKWLSDYLIGPPIQRQEITGEGGGPMVVNINTNVNVDDV